MIVKGNLSYVSDGYRRLNRTDAKYDNIEIGNYSIRNVKVDSYLIGRLETLLNTEIEVSIYKPKFLLPKTIVAIRTEDGTVYRNEKGNRITSGFLGYLIIGSFALAWLFIPYVFIFGTLGALFGSQVAWAFAITTHLIFTYSITNALKKAHNAFGKEATQHKVI